MNQDQHSNETGIETIDVLILGAGGGGYPAALFLAKAGLKVVMVDPFGNLGGDCLAEGCIPSKALRESALLRAMGRKYEYFGLRGDMPGFDWRAVLAHKDKVQNIRYSQHTAEIGASSMVFHKGRGRILGPHEAEVRIDNTERRYRFAWLIAATGSRPHILPVPGSELAITSHDIFRLGTDLVLPNHLAVIGGGYIGAETASMLNHLGTDVTILEATDALMPGIDQEMRDYLTRKLSERCTVLTSATATSIEKIGGGKRRLHYRAEGQERTLDADAVLMATGREAVPPDGGETIGLPASGSVKVDTAMRTALPHIFAPGDVNGRSMLFHSAVRQSMVAAHNILAGGQIVDRFNERSVPFTVFTEPELAWVGLDEVQARKQRLDVSVVRYDYETDSRAQIFDAMDGFIKLVFDNGTQRLIGAQIAGLDAAQVIAPLALAVEEQSTANVLTSMVFPHPMITEGINKAARKFQP
ncbi:MAG: dihydrolipoyl dehydrogenase [Acidiphilium sp.]|nr:dihydrolipoyl dehydrogenase [Acidiphilium sp.]